MAAGIEAISRAARLVKPDAIAWRGDKELPLAQQGSRVLGAAIGRTEFVVAHLEGKTREMRFCSSGSWRSRTPKRVGCSCWCAFQPRRTSGNQTRDFAERHDGLVWKCLKGVLGTPGAPPSAKATANLPLSMGGLGLSSAMGVRTAAFWASWVNSMKMVKERHPTIVNETTVGIDREEDPCFQSARTCQQLLVDAGFVVLPWSELVHTPPQAELEPEPNQPKFVWQQRVARQLHEHRQEEVQRILTDPRGPC